MCACTGVQREWSRQANGQAHWVPVRSGARWSVSGNDTWQQLGGCALAVLYIHVTTDKSQHLLSRRNYSGGATGSSIQDKERRMRTLPSACPSLSPQHSLSRRVATAVIGIGWAGVKMPTLSVPEVGSKATCTTWFGLGKWNLDASLVVVKQPRAKGSLQNFLCY